MELLGKGVLYIIMLCAASSAVVSVIDEESEFGRKFTEGIYAIGPIFLPVAGIMALIPILSDSISWLLEPFYEFVGADKAMAATTLIAVDMGGYSLAAELASAKESWIMAMITGYMAGATIVFSVPVGLKMVAKEDWQYMALGVMAGMMAIPFGFLVSCLCIFFNPLMVRSVISTDSAADYLLHFTLPLIFYNSIPLFIFCILIAWGLWKQTDRMIAGFSLLGACMEKFLRLVVMLAIVEYFTHVFSSVLGFWPLDPLIADDRDITRALEVAGYIGIMLAGAFPMVYLLQKIMSKAVGRSKIFSGRNADLFSGILAAAANILALFAMVKDLQPREKVLCIAFGVCGAFMFGDHLAFTANFQPNLIVPVLLGKTAGGFLAVYFAHVIVKHIQTGKK